MNLLPRAALLTRIQLLCANPLTGGAIPTGWEERFADPPADARILKIIHNWQAFTPVP